jgi:hypothetical protein
MYLSGEVRYSGRTDLIEPAVIKLIAHLCDVLAVGGLCDALRREQARTAPVPREFMTSVRASYRISQDGRGAIPMASNVTGVLP